jgi:hypothetical protein
VIVLPGVALATAFLNGKRSPSAVVGALVIGFGLAAVPTLGHLYVLFSGQPTSFALVAGLAVVVVTAFATSDGTYPVMAADDWRSNGTTQCFMEGTYKYMGVPTPARTEVRAPTHGGAFITFGNVALSSTHMVIFGAPGMRVLRCAVALLMALLGWILWGHFGGTKRLAVVGLGCSRSTPMSSRRLRSTAT